MDFFSHVLWTYVLFRSLGFAEQDRVLASFFGVLPDLAFVFAGLLLAGKYWLADRSFKRIRPRVFAKGLLVYRSSHSLVSFAVFFVLASLLSGFPYWLSFGWMLHILLDLGTHKGSPVEPQKPFFPFWNFSVKGWIWWRNPYFLIINWALLALVFFGFS